MEFLNYPCIGSSIKEFVKIFGEPVSTTKDSSLVMFDIGIEESSYLATTNLEGDVHNISFSMRTYDKGNQIGIELFAKHFLPQDSNLVMRLENKIIPNINANVPITIHEYYSESVKQSKGFILDEEDKGYITIYLCHDLNDSNIVVALGREEEIKVKNK